MGNLLRSGIIVASLLAAIPALGQRPSDPALLIDPQRDYTGNVAATDRTWFYLNTDGTPRPAGGGSYPAIEVSDDGSSANDITKAVYVRGNTVTMVLRLKDYLGSPDPIVGSLTLANATFFVGSTEYPISVSGPSSVSVPGNYGSQDVTLSFTGLPNSVAKGKLKFKSYVTLT